MARGKICTITAAMLLFSAVPMAAWAQGAQDPHHPEAQSPMPAPAPRMGGMPMMTMMGMGMMGGGMAGMDMTNHVEGRIAFLRTELKITDGQTRVWNVFAEALRTNAQSLGAARAAMMGGMGRVQTQTLAQRLDAQETWLTARLEGTRALKTAFASLYAALSDEQKQAADELLAPHMGLGPVAMSGMGMRQD